MQNQISLGSHILYYRLNGEIGERLKVILKFLSRWRFLFGSLVSGRKHFGNISWRTIIEESQLLGHSAIAIIHSQWLMPVYRFNLFRKHYPHVPIIISARGSQLTIHSLKRDSAELIVQNFEQADYIHCVSEDMRKRCISLGANPEKIFVNYNGINIDKFKPLADLVSTTSCLRLISVGALIWRKGFLFQLLALKELVSRGVNCSLTIIGTGNDEEAIRYTAEKLGVISFLIIEGQKSENEVLKSLQSAHIYLSTSAAEGLPNSLVEAAACGLPIVTFDCEGASEIIENEVSGFIVPFGSLQLMVDRVIVLKDQTVRMKMGNYAREKMERDFDERKWTGEMIQRYKYISSR
ncbi:MAG: glycosyltransferase family 4 protein [Cyclobacteriaceae bacterium]